MDNIFDIFYKFFKTKNNTRNDIIKYLESMIDMTKEIHHICEKLHYSMSQVSFLILFDVKTHQLIYKIIDFPYFSLDKKISIVDKSFEGLQNFYKDLIVYIRNEKINY